MNVDRYRSSDLLEILPSEPGRVHDSTVSQISTADLCAGTMNCMIPGVSRIEGGRTSRCVPPHSRQDHPILTGAHSVEPPTTTSTPFVGQDGAQATPPPLI